MTRAEVSELIDALKAKRDLKRDFAIARSKVDFVRTSGVRIEVKIANETKALITGDRTSNAALRWLTADGARREVFVTAYDAKRWLIDNIDEFESARRWI